jgi:predicted sulfurtransferase
MRVSVTRETPTCDSGLYPTRDSIGRARILPFSDETIFFAFQPPSTCNKTMAVAAALSTADDAPRHTAVVLFYKYFLTAEFPVLRQYEKYYEERLLASLKSLCQRLELKGRLLISAEGVNGTLSAASMEVLDEYIKAMETFDLIRECGEPSEVNNRDTIQEGQHKEYIFQNVDWKKSSNEGTHLPEPFPDLKVSIVKEIISSGGSVTVDEIPEHGGTHLTPKEFHRIMVEEDVVLVDVRSAYEVDIGHFIHPKTNQPALNPQIAQFSSFDDMFCAKQAEELKDKKVLMYCTGEFQRESESVCARVL